MDMGLKASRTSYQHTVTAFALLGASHNQRAQFGIRVQTFQKTCIWNAYVIFTKWFIERFGLLMID